MGVPTGAHTWSPGWSRCLHIGQTFKQTVFLELSLRFHEHYHH
ncbi:hypothetical protein HanXRQr2_Chr04g0185691 [Helianthus annuus]|uniref:Uncharacterized protein n=1 Tax=Helianthus annuus TaxID=4232 RepID=A0A9K3NUI1_HELAN|nr:hypothetical protein HanXRQr2_Chr04g0185691 [Helianthus annuus]KAJ0932927.1 hypothetical protein HanPSC8_Chr04g0179251 [Helianthus annuus]